MVLVEDKKTRYTNGVQAGVGVKSTGQQALDVIELIGEILWLLLKTFYAIGETIFRTFIPAPETSVKNEIVLVTGAGHGIGRELALKYASEGARVVCWDIDPVNNNKTVKEIADLGYTKAYAYQCDVSNRENIQEVAKKVEEEVGDVCVLINNAGIMPTHSLLDHSVQEIEKIFNINVLAHFWTIRAFLPSMLKNNHGHIVCLSSCAGLIGFNNLVPYCASKFAVRGLMESLHEELREIPGCRIKTTTIYPYMVDTGLCKKPKIRFDNIMPMLDPNQVASNIMEAQRRGIHEITVPGYIFVLQNLMRMFPIKAAISLKNFLNTGLESDL